MMAVRRAFVPETRVDEFGRIVIPKGIRDRLGLKSGSVLEIDERGDAVVLRSGRPEPPVAVRKGVLVFTGAATGDLDDTLRRHRSERLRSAAWPASNPKP
jgi:AbrB family looped-hinge helix DNA binding protein